jgi:hypothetical protein
MEWLISRGNDVCQFASLPCFLLPHGLEVPLHPIDAHRDAIDQRERFRVFREHWGEHAHDNVTMCRNSVCHGVQFPRSRLDTNPLEDDLIISGIAD